MVRSLFELVYGRLRNAYPPTRSYGPSDLAPPMPPLVAHFLRSVLDERAIEEIGGEAPERTWYDTTHPEVVAARQNLVDVARRHTQIPQAEWDEQLRSAVQWVTDFLVQPTTTAAAFIFGDSVEELPAETVQQRLDYFDTYSYLHEAVQAYADRNGEELISKERLTMILRGVDTHIGSDFSARSWLNLLEPMQSFYDSVTENGGGQLPVSVLATFFHEKGRTDIEQRLREYSKVHQREFLNATDLEIVMTSPRVRRPDDERQTPILVPEQKRDESQPLWMQFQERLNAPISVEPAAERQATEDHPVAREPEKTDGEDSDSPPRWEQFKLQFTGYDAPLASELIELEHEVLGVLTPEQRDKFIKDLFAGHEEEYVAVLLELRMSAGWADASRIIAEQVFRRFRVDIYSPSAVAFTDAAESRFRKKTAESTG